MTVVTHIYPGEASWSGTQHAEEREIADMTSKIRSLYDAGTPLYTKEAIRDIDQQLEKCVQRGEKVLVRGLDGIMVDFEIESGRTFPVGEPNLEMVLSAPFIHYVPIQELTSTTKNCIPRIAYCNLRIYHYMSMRNKFTKELVSTTPVLSDKEVGEFFKNIQNTWEASEQCKQLRSILTSTATPCEINKVVGFACGTMVYGCREHGTRTAFQHALILSLWDVLSKKKTSTNQIECYAQDPAYTAADRSVLDRYGITVLDNPKGFLEVDDTTAVISCAPDVPVKQIVSDLARPAIMIWNRISEDGTESIFVDSDSPRLRREINDFYDSFQFPGHYEYFGDLVIYIRRTP